MSRYHAVCSHGHHLTVMLDFIDHNTQPVQLSKIFILHKVLLTANVQNLTCLTIDLEKNLFVLSREIVVHLVDPRCVFIAGSRQLSELEIFRTK